MSALHALLTDEGFEVTTARDGLEALRCVEEGAPDALLTDISMPGLDGFGLIAAVRARFPEVIVVVMSGDHHGAMKILEGGALAYVSKPFEIDDVVGIIDAAIQLRREPSSRTS